MTARILISLIILICVQTLSFADDISRNPIKEINSDCSAGGALDQFHCFASKLENSEQRMLDILTEVNQKAKSIWGKEAEAELKKQLKSSQESWLNYRNSFCERNYYSEALSHPPSLSLEITACKYEKTEQRIEEIRNNYIPN